MWNVCWKPGVLQTCVVKVGRRRNRRVISDSDKCESHNTSQQVSRIDIDIQHPVIKHRCLLAACRQMHSTPFEFDACTLVLDTVHEMFAHSKETRSGRTIFYFTMVLIAAIFWCLVCVCSTRAVLYWGPTVVCALCTVKPYVYRWHVHMYRTGAVCTVL